MKRLTTLTATLALTCGLGLALSISSSTAASSLPTLTLAVTKNTVKVGGQKVSGAVNVATTVSGEAQDNPGLVLLKPGVTEAQFMKAAMSIDEESPLDAIDPYGTIVFMGGDSPEGKTTDTQVVLAPGRYLALNNGNGVAEFTVAKSNSPASLPTPEATVSAIEFGYRGATTLHDGELVRFQNDGYLIHMFQAARTASVANADKAEAQLLAGNTKGAEKCALGKPVMLAGSISSGQEQQSVINAPPGVYVVFCSMNTQDGREHFQLGMYRTITITK